MRFPFIYPLSTIVDIGGNLRKKANKRSMSLAQSKIGNQVSKKMIISSDGIFFTQHPYWLGAADFFYFYYKKRNLHSVCVLHYE